MKNNAILEGLHFPHWEIFDRIGHAFGNVKEELLGGAKIADAHTKSPLEEQLLAFSTGLTHLAESFFGSFFNIIGSTGIVVLLIIFMLLNREDIRGRVIKLIGSRSISSTTSAMDDASERVFGYLFRQFTVNMGFGICVATGLYFKVKHHKKAIK